jgi:hypothetical protein
MIAASRWKRQRAALRELNPDLAID